MSSLKKPRVLILLVIGLAGLVYGVIRGSWIFGIVGLLVAVAGVLYAILSDQEEADDSGSADQDNQEEVQGVQEERGVGEEASVAEGTNAEETNQDSGEGITFENINQESETPEASVSDDANDARQ